MNVHDAAGKGVDTAAASAAIGASRADSSDPSGDGPPSAGDLLGGLLASLDQSPAMVTITWGEAHLLAYQNAESVRVLGRRQLGLPVTQAFADIPADRWERLDHVRATGVAVTVPRTRLGLLDTVGEEMVLRYVMAPFGQQTPSLGVVMTAVDASAEAAAEQAADRAQLLALLGERLNDADSPDHALQALTDNLVPALADVAAVYVVTPATVRSTDAASAPTAITISPELLHRAGGAPPPAPPQPGPTPWEAPLAAGHTVLIDLDPQHGQDTVAPGVTRQWLTAAGGRNLAVVPLAVAGQLTAALVMLAADPRPPYRPNDFPFLADVGARAGAAVAHVRELQRQRDTAHTLQQALLPAAPPPLPGLHISARYVAGGADVEVGGDWWDVHHLGEGRVGLGVGDVSGRGIPAAILMGQARAGMRAAAHAQLTPRRILQVLDVQIGELVAEADGDDLPLRFATAVYAVIDPRDHTLRVANAGHPPLLVRYPDGAVKRVQAPPGAPLGLGVGGYTEVVIPLPVGSLLVAFTDGLVESRTTDLETGIRAVEDILRVTAPHSDIHAIADQILALADDGDDTALIVARTTN